MSRAIENRKTTDKKILSGVSKRETCFYSLLLILSGILSGCCVKNDTNCIDSYDDTMKKTCNGSFTIASYNIRSFRKMDKTRNVEGTLLALKTLQSDVCGLQEVRKYDNEKPSPLELAGERLSMKPFFCRTLRRDTFDYGIGVLSKFDAELIADIKLPVAPGREPRSAQILKINLPHGVFYFINTHLQNRYEEERIRQIKYIQEYAEKHGLCPAILTGDLNAAPGSAPIKLLEQKWKIIGDHTPTYPASGPKRKIDHIAVYPADAFEVISYETVNDPETSDHLPIKAQLRMIRK